MPSLVELLEATFRASGHSVSLEAQLEGRTGTVYTVPLMAEKDDQAILLMGHLEESPIPDELIQEFVETVKDTGATRGILCHAGPAWSKCPKELTFWDRATMSKMIGDALVAEALGLESPGLDVHLHAPTDLTDVLPEAFLESETEVVTSAPAHPEFAPRPSAIVEAIAEATAPPAMFVEEVPHVAEAEAEQPELAIDMPLDMLDALALSALAEPAAEAEPIHIPTPEPEAAMPTLMSYSSPATIPAVVPEAPAAPVPAPITSDLPSDPGRGLELDVDMLAAFPHVSTPAPAPTAVPVQPTPTAPLAPSLFLEAASASTPAPMAIPALHAPTRFAPTPYPTPAFAPPMGGGPAFVPTLPSPEAVANAFAPSIVTRATGIMGLPATEPRAPTLREAPPAPIPNIGISSLVAAAQSLARPAQAAPSIVPVMAIGSAAGSMPQTTHRMLPMKFDAQAASAKVAQKLFGVERAELILQPVHLFDFEVDNFKDGSLELDTIDGRIEVNGSDKGIRIVDPDECNPDARGIPMPNVAPTERVTRVNSERARQLALAHVAKTHAKAVDVRIPDHNSGLYYAERRKVEPRPEQMRVNPLGVFLRPVWRLHGSNGQVDVDAHDGHEVFAEVRNGRTDAIILD